MEFGCYPTNLALCQRSANDGSVLIWFSALLVLWNLTGINAFAACRSEKAAFDRHGWHRSLQRNRAASLILKSPKELGATQVSELIAVADTPCQPYSNQAIFMLDADLRGARKACKLPVAPLKKNEANIRLADYGIATGIPLLLVNRVEIISNDKIGHGPNIGCGSATVVFGDDLINKAGIAVLVDLQRRGFDSIRTFVETDPRANGESGLFLHLFHGVLHGKQLKEIDCGYDHRHEQSGHGYFIRLQTANPSAEYWHVDFLRLGAQCFFWMSVSYGSARLIVFYGRDLPFLMLLALALLFVFIFQLARTLITYASFLSKCTWVSMANATSVARERFSSAFPTVGLARAKRRLAATPRLTSISKRSCLPSLRRVQRSGGSDGPAPRRSS